MELRSQYTVGIAVLSIIFLAVSLTGRLLFGEIFLIFALALMLWLVLTVQVEIYERIQERFNGQDTNYSQIEALFSIFSSLKINHPLPGMRGWAISPDLAKIIIDLIQEKKPALILEAGSGVSTLIAAYCLKAMGEGKLISLEEKEKYAEASKQNVIKHGLQEFATVIHAPLKEIAIGEKKWLWYDPDKLEGIGKIDFLIIDGPIQFGRPEKMLRYPALPLLRDCLSKEAVIVMDDCNREDEKKVAELWAKEFPDFEMEKINTEFGTVILRRKEVSPS